MADPPPQGEAADAAAEQQQPPAPVEVVSDDRNSGAGQQQANFQQQHMMQQPPGVWYPAPPPHPQHYPHQQHALAYYEAQMRDHAVAYANAAAGAAWAAAQIATNPLGAPPVLPMPGMGPMMMPPFPPHPQQQMGWGPPHYHQPEAPHPYQDDDMSELSFQSPFAHHQPQHQESDQSSEIRQQQQPARKRLQRASEASPAASRSSPNERHHGHKRGRRRLHSALGDSSDTSNSAHRHSHKHVRHGKYASASSARGRHNHYKRDPMSSLLGKTGVSALYEWCDKQRMSPPTFVPHQVQVQDCKVPEFEFSVQIDGQEWSLGRGASKAAAKQDAAQKALVNLAPGAAFDDSGLLIKMPSDEVRDDLAPTLASQLAIGTSETKKKRHWNVYPGTSTTSEEDEENTYYASRGASVCSALLHMMWQIDDRIKDPPSYVYDLVTNPANTNTQLKRKGPMASGPAMVVHRSSFRCTARLQMRRTADADVDDEPDLSDGKSQVGIAGSAAETERHEADDRGETKPRAETDTNSMETLLAIGTGSTKREARHKASSKLLAMLFPECNGMVEVKAAAEAAREQYTAMRALKQGPRNPIQHKRQKQCDSRGAPFRKRSFDVFAPDPSEPPLPSYLHRELHRHFHQGGNDVALDEVSVESLSISDSVLKKSSNSKETGIAKGSSRSDRCQQLISHLDSALHEMNELSEDGRTSPEEISENDVGVTVLRRAEPEDVKWIRSLLQKNHTPDACDLVMQGPASSLLSSVARPASLSTDDAHVWKAVSITLLLCRKIAPFEDPPLGFATLTLGFSMEKGRTLRVASIVSEPHLPRERFLECLERFASLMNCELERESSRVASTSRATEDGTERLEASELQSLLSVYVSGSSCEGKQPGKYKPEESSGMLDLNSIGASLLQSVQEEDTEAEETDTAQGSGRKSKPNDKPNKRSRVA